MHTLVYLSLGGNIGNTRYILNCVVEELKKSKEVVNLEVSKFYQTKPISPIPQPDFINAACRFHTNLTPEELYLFLHEIEKKYGKVDKPKDFPRPIDIDILFYGGQNYLSENLEIPHPRWKERLFVLIPLLDLTKHITICDQTFDLVQLANKLQNHL